MIPVESKVSATELARSLSELLNRVRYRGEEFLIERHGEPLCRIVPVRPRFTLRELVELLKSAPKPDPGYWDAVEEVIRTQPPLPESPWSR